jgi:hypothetical protein
MLKVDEAQFPVKIGLTARQKQVYELVKVRATV